MVFQTKTIKHWLVFLRISSVLTQAAPIHVSSHIPESTKAAWAIFQISAANLALDASCSKLAYKPSWRSRTITLDAESIKLRCWHQALSTIPSAREDQPTLLFQDYLSTRLGKCLRANNTSISLTGKPGFLSRKVSVRRYTNDAMHRESTRKANKAHRLMRQNPRMEMLGVDEPSARPMHCTM